MQRVPAVSLHTVTRDCDWWEIVMWWKQLSRQPEADEKCWHHAARSRGKSHPHTNHCVNKNLNQFLWITGGLKDGLVGDSVGKVAPSFTVGPAISLQEHLVEKNTTKTDFCAFFPPFLCYFSQLFSLNTVNPQKQVPAIILAKHLQFWGHIDDCRTFSTCRLSF